MQQAVDSVDSIAFARLDPQSHQNVEMVLRSFAAARHTSDEQRPLVVSLTVAFDRSEERQLLTAFVRAATFDTLLSQRGLNEGWQQFLTSWVEQEITEEKLTPLFQGTLRLLHIGLPHHLPLFRQSPPHRPASRSTCSAPGRRVRTRC